MFALDALIRAKCKNYEKKNNISWRLTKCANIEKKMSPLKAIKIMKYYKCLKQSVNFNIHI